MSGREAEATLSMAAQRGAVGGAILLGAILAGGQVAAAQSVTAVPNLDPKRLTGSWYEVARYPTKFENRCAGQAAVLFAEGNKPRSIQMGTFCPGKNGSEQEYATTGKMDKKGDGKITLGPIWPFTKKYWILAVAPDGSWALAGQPNRKTLSVLSRTTAMDDGTLRLIGAKAQAEGYTLDKLVSLPKQSKTYKAEDGRLQETQPAPALTKPPAAPKP